MDKKEESTLVLIVLLGCSVYIVNYYKIQREAQESYERLQTYKEEEREQRLELEVEAETEESDIEKFSIPVDFGMLQESNLDIYAWISILGTQIDYLILQSPADDSYYLDHIVDGVKGLPGSIYTESLNTKDFIDPNTLILKFQKYFKNI